MTDDFLPEIANIILSLYEKAEKIDPGYKQVVAFSLQKNIEKRERNRQNHGVAVGLRTAAMELETFLDDAVIRSIPKKGPVIS